MEFNFFESNFLYGSMAYEPEDAKNPSKIHGSRLKILWLDIEKTFLGLYGKIGRLKCTAVLMFLAAGS